MNPYIVTLTYFILLQCVHSIFLLKIGNDYKTLFRLVNRYLADGFAVIFGVELKNSSGFSKLQRYNLTFKKMEQSRLIENIEDHIQSNALRIVDVEDIYLHDESIIDVTRIIRKWISLVKESKRMRHFKGVVVIAGGTRLFTDSMNLDKLVIYEHSLLDVIVQLGSLRVICCYLEESLDVLHFSHLVSLVTMHQCSINNSDNSPQSRQILAAVVMEAIADGTEEVLGKGSWNLLSRTMKLIYGLNENTVVSNPALFEEKLQRVLGASSEIVLTSINKKIKTLLT